MVRRGRRFESVRGLHKSPANGHVVLPALARFRRFAGTRRVHFGTGGHSRARATSRDIAWNVLEILDRCLSSKSSCKQASALPILAGRLTPSFAREEVMRSAWPRPRTPVCHAGGQGSPTGQPRIRPDGRTDLTTCAITASYTELCGYERTAVAPARAHHRPIGDGAGAQSESTASP
jgi:hypothetical protein